MRENGKKIHFRWDGEIEGAKQKSQRSILVWTIDLVRSVFYLLFENLKKKFFFLSLRDIEKIQYVISYRNNTHAEGQIERDFQTVSNS